MITHSPSSNSRRFAQLSVSSATSLSFSSLPTSCARILLIIFCYGLALARLLPVKKKSIKSYVALQRNRPPLQYFPFAILKDFVMSIFSMQISAVAVYISCWWKITCRMFQVSIQTALCNNKCKVMFCQPGAADALDQLVELRHGVPLHRSLIFNTVWNYFLNLASLFLFFFTKFIYDSDHQQILVQDQICPGMSAYSAKGKLINKEINCKLNSESPLYRRRTDIFFYRFELHSHYKNNLFVHTSITFQKLYLFVAPF